MSKINISLVGRQTMPVYVGLEVEKFDLIILIHSSETKDEAAKICRNNNIKMKMVEISAVDYTAASAKACELLDELIQDEVMLNVTSGTKPWSVAFAMQSVGRKNVTVFYIDQNNIYRDMTHHVSKDLELNLDISTLLKYHNQYGYTHVNLSEYTDEDRKVLKTVKNLRYNHFKEFSLLTLTGKDKEWGKKLKNEAYPYKELPYPQIGKVLWNKGANVVELTFSDRNNTPYTTRLQSEHVGDIVFNAGWLEYQIAKMLSRWKQAKEVWMNVKFPYTDGKDKNEIDIIVNMGNKLLFVECKTNIFDNTDIDKFRTAVKNYGGMGSKALFIADVLKMKEATSEKCKDSKIMTFCLKSKKSDERNKALFSMLDEELKKINKE